MSTLKRPLFVKSDIDAAFGVFFDGFTKVIAGVAIMIGSIGLSSKVVLELYFLDLVLEFFSFMFLHGGLEIKHQKKQIIPQ